MCTPNKTVLLTGNVHAEQDGYSLGMCTPNKTSTLVMMMGVQQRQSVATMQKNRSATSTSRTTSGVFLRVCWMLKNMAAYDPMISARL